MIFPVLLGLVGCGVLLSLGVWQLHRMEWKAAILAEMDARIGGTPSALPATLDPVADKFRPVTTEGRFTGAFVEVLAGQKGASPGVRIIEAFDTAGAAQIVAEAGDPTRAAVAPVPAADAYGLSILRNDLQDSADNRTRFVLLSAAPA